MLKWQRRKDERPNEILAAALGLFVRKGFVSTTMDDIAKKAGVSKGTVYLYFPSKDSLFKNIVHELMVPKIAEVEVFIAAYEGSQSELLKLIISKWWATVNRSGLAGIPKLILTNADKFPALTKLYVKEVIHRIQTVLVTIIETGIELGEFRRTDPVLSARVIMSSLVYFSIWHITLRKYDQKNLTVENLIEQQIEIILNGITK